MTHCLMNVRLMSVPQQGGHTRDIELEGSDWLSKYLADHELQGDIDIIVGETAIMLM